MGKQLQAIIIKLEQMAERAGELADSESEKTAEKYADIPDMLEEAIGQLQEIVTALEG